METKTEKVRYSDEELQEFKELILKKLAEAEDNYRLEKEVLMADESNPTFKMMEEGSNTQVRERARIGVQRQADFIAKLRAALVRIENKTYGICRVTGKLIPKGRLLAVPHATTSIEGKEIEQRRKSGIR
ncbi:MAG: TraR/DksA family transcriptional regulator [Muribaculaceae bacterium]|nr:TraR/DksA family transcriptional regulator [Muribaculaceae bacterium]